MEKTVLEAHKQFIGGGGCMHTHGDWRKQRRKSSSERTGGPSEGHPVAFLPHPDSQDMTGRTDFPHCSL